MKEGNIFKEWEPAGFFEYKKRVMRKTIEIHQLRVCKYIVILPIRFLSKAIE